MREVTNVNDTLSIVYETNLKGDTGSFTGKMTEDLDMNLKNIVGVKSIELAGSIYGRPMILDRFGFDDGLFLYPGKTIGEPDNVDFVPYGFTKFGFRASPPKIIYLITKLLSLFNNSLSNKL